MNKLHQLDAEVKKWWATSYLFLFIIVYLGFVSQTLSANESFSPEPFDYSFHHQHNCDWGEIPEHEDPTSLWAHYFFSSYLCLNRFFLPRSIFAFPILRFFPGSQMLLTTKPRTRESRPEVSSFGSLLIHTFGCCCLSLKLRE